MDSGALLAAVALVVGLRRQPFGVVMHILEVNQETRRQPALFQTHQIFLQHLLGLPTPRYLHLPVALNDVGEKLDKQTFAMFVADAKAGERLPILRRAFRVLEPPSPSGPSEGDLESFWR